jgi:hypothetical protein
MLGSSGLMEEGSAPVLLAASWIVADERADQRGINPMSNMQLTWQTENRE